MYAKIYRRMTRSDVKLLFGHVKGFVEYSGEDKFVNKANGYKQKR